MNYINENFVIVPADKASNNYLSASKTEEPRDVRDSEDQ